MGFFVDFDFLRCIGKYLNFNLVLLTEANNLWMKFGSENGGSDHFGWIGDAGDLSKILQFYSTSFSEIKNFEQMEPNSPNTIG